MGTSKNKKSTAKAKAGRSADPMELVFQAEDVLAVGDVQQAQALMAQALAAAPRDPHVLTAFGSMLAEVGNTDKAILTLKKAVCLAPHDGHEKYMYLGQLLGQTDEADSAFCTGIELLRGELEALEEAGASGERCGPVSHALCSALCSLAELRMLRAEKAADVEENCTQLLEQACSVAPSNPEPLQALASLRYELDDAAGALPLLRQSMERWWSPPQEQDGDAESPMSGEGMQSEDGGMRTGEAGAASKPQPSYEFRFECCKLLLELDETTDVAIEVLEDLLSEHDQAPHTWHLLALAYYGGGMFTEATETLEYGYKLLKQLELTGDEEVVGLFDELKHRIQEGVQTLGGAAHT